MSLSITQKLLNKRVDGWPAVHFYDVFKEEPFDIAFQYIVLAGIRHLYFEDLTERDYTLENTTPYYFEILGNVFTDHSWGILLCNVSKYLFELYPEYLTTAFDFRCPWSKQAMFSDTDHTNYKKVCEGIFVNVNHTALHSCWLLQDLLDFFHVDKDSVLLLLNRPSGAESPKVREFFSIRIKKGFSTYLVKKHGKTQESTETIIRIIEKNLNPRLKRISKSYIDFFLFDDLTMYTNYMNKVKDLIRTDMRLTDKQKRILNKCLDYLHDYLKF